MSYDQPNTATSVEAYEATHDHSDPTYSAANAVAVVAIAGAALWICAIAIFLAVAMMYGTA